MVHEHMAGERAALPADEGVLLWSMRTWVLGLIREFETAPRIRAAFQGLEPDLDADAAAAGLGGFMRALERHNLRTIAVDTMCAQRVSADERALLDVFAGVQAGEVGRAVEALRGMIAPAALGPALDCAENVAAALAAAGHTLGGHAAADQPGAARLH